MKKTLFALLLAATAAANAATFTDYARVIHSEPIYDHVNTQSCRNVPVTEIRQGGTVDSDTGAAVLGGLVGGVLGNQVGQGRGRTAATIVGAIGGSMVGRQLNNQPSERTAVRHECQDVAHDELTGYRVTYEYRGHRDTMTLPNAPGNRLEMRVTADPVVH